MTQLMNPEAIIERATARPFAGGEAVHALRRNGWHLVYAEHKTEEEMAPWDNRLDRFRVLVWGGESHSREILTSHQLIERASYPDAYLKAGLESAWTDLALPLGRDLGVIE